MVAEGLNRRLDSQYVADKVFEATGCLVDPQHVETVADYVKVTCPEHGTWQALPEDLMRGHGCRRCWHSSRSSKGEREIGDYIRSLGFKVDNNAIVDNVSGEIDLEVTKPCGDKVYIDFHSTWYHGDEINPSPLHHTRKLEQINGKFLYIQIMEDEWALRKEIVKTRLAHVLGVSGSVVYARHTKVRKVSWAEAKNFYEEHHLQGSPNNTSDNWGLYKDKELLACISFSKPRFTKDVDVELLRFASVGSVVGGFSKLLKNYLRQHPEVETIGTYADRMWSEGEVYGKQGFEFKGHTKPGYSWYKGLNRVSRYDAQKHKLKNWLESFDPNLSEDKNMRAAGYWRVYNAGNTRWVYNRNKKDQNFHSQT